MSLELTWKWTKNVLSANRKTAGIFTDILPGYGDIRSHLQKWELAFSPLCGHCQKDEEAVTHVLCHFLANAAKRQEVTGENFLEKQDILSMAFTAILLSSWGNLRGGTRREWERAQRELNNKSTDNQKKYYIENESSWQLQCAFITVFVKLWAARDFCWSVSDSTWDARDSRWVTKGLKIYKGK